MKKRSLWLCQLALLVSIVCASLTPGSTNAQGPTPPPTPTPAPPETRATRIDGMAVIDKGDSPDTLGERLQALRSPEDRAADDTPATTEAPSAPAPVAPARQSAAVSPNAAQLAVDVSVPDEIRAGDDLLYTYAYTNTGTTTASKVVIEAIWTEFSTSPRGNKQFCGSTLCDVQAGSVVGPNVTRVAPASGDRARYSLSGLAAGQSGRFSVLLGTKADIYPKTNQPPTRPAGSAQIYLDNSTVPSDDETASTLVVGPVLVLTKAPVDRNLKIYPTETAEFIITVGNATGAGDKVGSAIRADARPATNVVVRDTFPIGGEFVAATGNPVVNNGAKTVTWTLGSLNTGASQEFRITFRKANVNANCGVLSNSTYSASSDEYPKNGAIPYVVNGSGASVPVIAPIVIKSVTTTPGNVVYGNTATITIVVQNFWREPVNGAQLNYDIQTNAFYQSGSATPNPSTTPNSATPGGRLAWTFNMPAGNKTTPTEATFTLDVRGAYDRHSQAGVAQVIAPAGIPSACIVSRNGKVNFLPRLEVVKAAELDPTEMSENAFLVQRNQEVAYTLTIKNEGNADATSVDVIDSLPRQDGANFTYIPNSATLNGQPLAPDSVSDGKGGSLIWNDLTVPAGGTIQLRYRLNVDGHDYVPYCNTVALTSGNEEVDRSKGVVCVKINPQIEIIKTADRTATTAGGEVQFTLQLTNREPRSYRVGIYDLLGEFTYVRQVSGYAQPEVIRNGDALQWPLIDLAPGQMIQATIVATVPNDCRTRDYVNEGMFHNPEYVVRRIPRAEVRVKVTCGVVEFSKSKNRDIVSLGDRIIYTLNIRNADAAPASNIKVDDILPPGFRYEAMEPSSGITTPPTQNALDGTTKLSWTIPTLDGTRSVSIKFIARAGNVVGEHTNRMIVPTGGKCTGGCVNWTDGLTYSAARVKVQPLITLEPSINTDACARPGDKRVYELKIVNTNNHDYTNTTVSVALPFGLNYAGPRPNMPEPTVTTTDAGSTLTWSGLRVLAKPGNVFASQLTLAVELEVGQVLGNLDTLVTTSSDDGTIPRKDGVADPTVPVCVTDPTIAIDAYPRLVRLDGEVLYQISLVNTTTSPIQATVEDTLPAAFSYVRAVEGPPATVNGNTLRWNDVTIPAAGERPGIVRIKFRAQLTNGVAGQSYTNTARVTESSVPFDTTLSSVTVTAADEVYSVFLPLTIR